LKTRRTHLADIDMWCRREIVNLATRFPEPDNEERRRLLQVIEDEYLQRRDLVMAVYKPSGEYSQVGLKMMCGAKAHRKDPEWRLPDGTLF
jgi:hypothetical protein